MKFDFKEIIVLLVVTSSFIACVVSGYHIAAPSGDRSRRGFGSDHKAQLRKDLKAWIRRLAEEGDDSSAVLESTQPITEVRTTTEQPSGATSLLKELCSWKTLEWNLEETAVCSTSAHHEYPPQNKIPFGVAHTHDRVFIAVPRVAEGVISTLNVFFKSQINDALCPKLSPYPSFSHNVLHSTCCSNIYDRFVSVWRLNIDQCTLDPKLWFIDTGTADYPKQSIRYKQPTLNIISLTTNLVLLSRVIPNEVVKIPNGLKVVVPNVDVEDDCNSGYGYILDSVLGRIITYSLHEDKFWTFEHNYFKLTPLESHFEIEDGEDVIAYDVTDNIFSLALDLDRDVAYLHSKASLTEFFVDLDDLNNRTLASCLTDSIEVYEAGYYDSKGQAGTHFFSKGTVFGVQEQLHGVFCLNAETEYDTDSYSLPIADSGSLPFLADLSSDGDTLLLLSNNYQQIKNNGFSVNKNNFRLWEVSVQELLTAAPSCGNASNANVRSKAASQPTDADTETELDEEPTSKGGAEDSTTIDPLSASAVKSGAMKRLKTDPKLTFPGAGNETSSTPGEGDDGTGDSEETREGSAVLSGAESRPKGKADALNATSNTLSPKDEENLVDSEKFFPAAKPNAPPDGPNPTSGRHHNNPSTLYNFFQGPFKNSFNGNQHQDQGGGAVQRWSPSGGDGNVLSFKYSDTGDSSGDTDGGRSHGPNSSPGGKMSGSQQYIYLNIVNTCQQEVGCPFSDKCRALSLCSSFSQVKELSPQLQENFMKMCTEYLCSFCGYCPED